MINSINSNVASAMQQAPRMDKSQSLSEAQQQTIKDTLANFDADNLSASDATSIAKSFSEAGIRPGTAMESAMKDLGFDAKAVGEMAGVEQSRPMGPPPGGGRHGGGGQVGQLNLSDEMMSSLNDLLEEYSSGTLEGSERESMLTEIKDILAKGAPEGGLFSFTA
ncbi:hypothetical protein [Allochromatium palmeri]|uniref:Uncharacterized protein n=1 Tax=Allochromatium palmeri TaxID=231048 RepID=A0A6N8EGR6_9GAMM|nr:hypothetical protein [Allochromatium palmeri]MTW21564.1 hypothetical protein [Allochromatium palmeri]